MSETIALERPLPVGGVGTHGSGWWGLLAMLVTEACLFGYLLFAYFYLAAQSTAASSARFACFVAASRRASLSSTGPSRVCSRL